MTISSTTAQPSKLHASSAQPTSTAEILRASGSLTLGAKGPAVIALQTALKQLGFFSRNIDGDFGGLTLVSLLKFKLARGLITSSDTEGPECLGSFAKTNLLESLCQLTPRPDQIIQTLRASGSLTLGAKGPAVIALQTALKQLGFFSRNIDGDFGGLTLVSLLKFKLARGLITSSDTEGPECLGSFAKTNLLRSLEQPSRPAGGSIITAPSVPVLRIATATAKAALAVNSVQYPTPDAAGKSVNTQQYINYLEQINTLWKELFRYLHDTLVRETYVEFCDRDMPPCITIDLKKLDRFATNGFLPNHFGVIKTSLDLYGTRYDAKTLQELTNNLEEISRTFTQDIWMEFQNIFAGAYLTCCQTTLQQLAEKINSVLARTIGNSYRVTPSGDVETTISIAEQHLSMTDLASHASSGGEFPHLNSGFAFEAPDGTASEFLPPKVRVVHAVE